MQSKLSFFNDEVPQNDKPKVKKRMLRLALFGAIFLVALMLLGSQFFSSGDTNNGDASESVLMESPHGSSFAGVISPARTSFVIDTPPLTFVQGISLQPAIPPITLTPQVLGSILGTVEQGGGSRQDIFHYAVESGDTIDSLASEFNISPETIMWANQLTRSSRLQEGKEIVILPVSGTLHLVRQNDTLSEIAQWYKGDINTIVEFNDLTSASDIYAGDILIIPGGAQPAQLPAGRLTPVANSYFIRPVPAPYHISQGLHAFNAVDMSTGVCGSPIYAAAGGSVQKVGYHSVGGNYVRVLHPNGVVTYYGHMSGYTVAPGQRVLQGQILGYIGHTGYTIPSGSGGCHLHFEVRGATNPFAK
ncbi:MAG: hypothetical protein A3E07_02335 [Candidatus Wildermuthbacteria bacterium RIFCSPHIGHO2_12_FULL_45_9]|uniref:LysM domain-containing protein n=1 Tax=Candidatus Wildermuthbacteria bacterium RIFCSPHIGHO2_02_FULL_45_25 TaxID=1802450 RepID=A0A1G2QZ30_9BACT|nr:MAG: hypothetical protein A2748_03495 [Candidatus Wildermuthbacteria bacterium RIFCSPHIGHO2_01_FULL_45_20]OHA65894.1 MAG: hypothetical protein A3C04_00140 [Candidatus Wildermuthbacteria bacterium RIFCSPHIGHO2_02_FULL_45_25]OHA70861.1 MAG: hypothetical protein A3E07_02335 [Candidatus Wildermuthbacteria bacterium RIFCSPHIGHO2_12_FULL_45_9]